jgi:hypothetical protein
MLNIINDRYDGDTFRYITAKVQDEKVEKIILRIRPEWNNSVVDITVYFKSKRIATYDSVLSNHRMPIKYRNYIKEIMKEVK